MPTSFAIVDANYYLRVIWFMSFDESKAQQSIVRDRLVRTALAVNGLAVVAIGVAPNTVPAICATLMG